ncbi:MAG: O-antigen ligase family protein [Candidatus Omnitrophica bacterium]|nr:O-antigen ligase family protein [Candidatus Omnitrophota bacterium]
MNSISAAVKRWVPELDERIWLPALAVGGFAVLFMKEVSVPFLLLAVAFAAFAWWTKDSPEMSLYLLAAYLPFGRLVSDPAETPNILLTGLLAGAVLALALAGRRMDARFFSWTPLGGAVALFAGLSVFSLFRASFLYGEWYFWSRSSELAGWLMQIGFFFLVFWTVRDARSAKTLISVILGAVFMVGMMATWEYVGSGGDSFESSRVWGIADEPNRLGAFFVSYMFFFPALFLADPRRRSYWFLAIPFLFSLRGLMVTFSRGGYLAFAAGVLAAAWFRHKGLFVLAVATGLFLLMNPAFLPGGIRYRLEMTVAKNAPKEAAASLDLTRLLEASASDRFEIWDTSVRIIQDHPWWGVGFGAFAGFFADYSSGRMEFDNAHNAFLMIAAEQGIPAALLFFLILCLAVDQAVRLYQRTADRQVNGIALGFAAGVVGMTVANLFSHCFGFQEISGYFWMLAGVVAKLWVLEQRRPMTAAEYAGWRERSE